MLHWFPWRRKEGGVLQDDPRPQLHKMSVPTQTTVSGNEGTVDHIFSFSDRRILDVLILLICGKNSTRKKKQKKQITQRKSESSVCSRKNRWYILDWIFSWKVCRLVVIAGKLRFIWNVKKYLLFCVSVHSESAVFRVQSCIKHCWGSA